jgi:hypothetical protein
MLIFVQLSCQVFIWWDEHDRQVISNLIGLHFGNGFDTSRDANATATWTRMSSGERDAIQREFDPAVNGSKLYHRFMVGL